MGIGYEVSMHVQWRALLPPVPSSKCAWGEGGESPSAQLSLIIPHVVPPPLTLFSPVSNLKDGQFCPSTAHMTVLSQQNWHGLHDLLCRGSFREKHTGPKLCCKGEDVSSLCICYQISLFSGLWVIRVSILIYSNQILLFFKSCLKSSSNMSTMITLQMVA